VLVLAAALVALASLLALAVGCDMPSTGGLGQVGGSGDLVTKDYVYTGFTKVTVDSAFEVSIAYAESAAVSVTVDDNLVQEHLKVELDGDTLHIGLAPLWRYHDVTLRATVVMPRISALEVSGASSAVVTEFTSGDPLQITASGASALNVTTVRLGTVTLELSGASRVEGSATLDELAGGLSGASAVGLTGSAGSMRLDVSGGSRLELYDLPVETADLTLSGGSLGRVLVTGTLDAAVSGGSRVEYLGDPELGTIDVSGGSDVAPAAD
jgi:hypothetical protein